MYKTDRFIVGINVVRLGRDRYGLYWVDDRDAEEYICTVYGFENAVRVANGISHEQVEWVKHPGFDPDAE
jgi:hypothetical protein